MDPADAAGGRRRTQAWMGAPVEAQTPPAQAQDHSKRWIPSSSQLPAYPQPPPEPPPEPPPQAGPSPAAAATGPRQAGALIGDRYRLVRALGQGALTETWEATHAELERAVALKFLRSPSADIAARMVEEARAVARIRHPHVAEFSDFGRTDAGEPFFVMELLRGETVEQLLTRRGAIAWARAVVIAQQVGEALEAAHQQGIVHRDLRPGNVFLLETGQAGDFIKVVDFGLARGAALGGTPSYMSPEQCRGEALDPRSDVYALGCLLFALITGDPPFVGEPNFVIQQQLQATPKTLRERAPRRFIPDELEAIIVRCLAKLPAQRFADTHELLAQLAQLAQFSAAASLAGAAIQDPRGPSPQPMSFAGRAAPQPAPQLAPQPNPPPAAPPAAKPMSTAAIVALTVVAVGALVGVGLGGYWLAQGGKQDGPGIEGARGGERAVAPVVPPAPNAELAASPSPSAGEGEGEGGAGEVEVGEVEGAVEGEGEGAGEAEVAAAEQPSDAPAGKPKPGKDGGAEAPTVTPAPVPSTKPKTKPDSKAKDQIGLDELRDPWGE